MGTHCHIGIEYTDGIVEYFYVHFDGYFAGVVPNLRKYKNREDVEKMIKEQSTEKTYIYSLIDISRRQHVPYIYVFSKDNEWLCYTDSFFEMKYLSFE